MDSEITNPGGDVVVNTVPAGTRPSAALTPAVVGDEQATDRIARSAVEVGDDGAMVVRVPELPSSVINTGGSTVITTGGGVVVAGGNGGITVNGTHITGGTVQVGSTGAVLVTASLPDGADVRIESTGGGSVATTGHLGEVVASTTGGDLRVQRADEAELDTSGGDVELGTIAGYARARTSGGNITAERLLGGGRLRTSGGNIRAHLAAAVELEARSSGGNVRITTAPGVSTEHVRARTSGGATSVRQQHIDEEGKAANAGPRSR